ncbi:MAG: rhomboid family intramembrane serine protease, partial [Kiritimatiellae bacterium]|nr:rhomboid family intramembrane serine protease [Kiritimatiellia bacterium]
MGRASDIFRAPLRAATAIPPATRAVALSCLVAHLVQRVVAAAPIRTVFLGGGGEDFLLVPDVLSFLFAISGGALSLGFLWTPATYLFLHAGWSHLLLNGIGLLVFGSAVEREAGRGAFWSVWFGAGVTVLSG